MAIIQANFTPAKQRTFDYQAFRAEFVRRKRQTSYQRVHEDAAKQPKPEPLISAEGKPHWAEFQIEPGIANLIHCWQAERYTDPDDGLIRYTQGALELVRHPVVEPFALDVIENEAQLLRATNGRTFLTTEEYRILNLSKRYLAESDAQLFRHKYYGFEPKYRRDGSLIESLMFGWIAKATGYTPAYVEMLLIAAENVYRMRATLGMESAPEVQLAPARTRESSIGRAA